MSDKRTIRQSLKHVQSIKTWQLFILLILSLFISATFLRLNNTGMIQRRDAIAGADKTGNSEEIALRVYDLQRYVSAHMNADPGAVYLQEQYNRDVKAAVTLASGDLDGYDTPQARADAICNPNLHSRGYSKAYQDCMLRELSREGLVVDPGKIKMPNPALYRYSFSGPVWSPDFAGWSVFVSILLTVIIVVRIVIALVLRLLLRYHYRQV